MYNFLPINAVYGGKWLPGKWCWVNIQIIRTFTKLRELIASNRELRLKIEKLENKYGQQFKVVFEAIKKLLAAPITPSHKIGFRVYKENRHRF